MAIQTPGYLGQNILCALAHSIALYSLGKLMLANGEGINLTLGSALDRSLTQARRLLTQAHVIP
jgi:hypothetical protein